MTKQDRVSEAALGHPAARVPAQVQALDRRLGITTRVPPTVRQLQHAVPALALLWVPVLLAVWGHLPGSRDYSRATPMLQALLIGGLAPMLVAAGVAWLRARSLRGAARLLWSNGWLTERPLRYVLLSVTLSAFFWAFASWKTAIPMVHPFTWDPELWALGARLHGGQVDAMLAPVFGSPRAIIALDALYESWGFVLFGLILWQAWQRDLERAKRFLLAFALTWIVLGVFMATAFSSAGPWYERLVTRTHGFDSLFARLNAADASSPLAALRAQHYLWEAQVRGVVTLGSGISAFPSLHVAGAALAALTLSDRNRWLGALAWVYVGLTGVASVMLGWHYALDGEVAILGTLVIWRVAGSVTDVAAVMMSPRWTWEGEAPLAVAAEPETPRVPGARRSWSLWP
jgi:hypothetical protein